MLKNRQTIYQEILSSLKNKEERDKWKAANGEFNQWAATNFENNATVTPLLANLKRLLPQYKSVTVDKFYENNVCDIVSSSKDKNKWGQWVEHCQSLIPKTSEEWFNEQVAAGFFPSSRGKFTTTQNGSKIFVENAKNGDLIYYYGPSKKDGKLYYIRYENGNKDQAFKGEYELEFPDAENDDSMPDDIGDGYIPESFVKRCLMLIKKTNKDLLKEQRLVPNTEVRYNPAAQTTGNKNDEINAKRNRYFTTNLKLNDSSFMSSFIGQAKDLIEQGYYGEQFNNIYVLLQLSSTQPTSQQWQKDLFNYYKNFIMGKDEPEKLLSNPTNQQLESGEVFKDTPAIWSTILKSNQPIFKKDTTKFSYEKKDCKASFNEYYDAFKLGFQKGGRDWCTTPKAKQMRKIVLGCKNAGKLGMFQGGRKFEDLVKGKVGGFEYPECKLSFSEK